MEPELVELSSSLLRLASSTSAELSVLPGVQPMIKSRARRLNAIFVVIKPLLS
jgi:hypothetical protein